LSLHHTLTISCNPSRLLSGSPPLSFLLLPCCSVSWLCSSSTEHWTDDWTDRLQHVGDIYNSSSSSSCCGRRRAVNNDIVTDNGGYRCSNSLNISRCSGELHLLAHPGHQCFCWRYYWYAANEFVADLTHLHTFTEFRIYPGGHAVARSDFGYPCIPYELTGLNRVGFYSGEISPQIITNDVSPLPTTLTSTSANLARHSFPSFKSGSMTLLLYSFTVLLRGPASSNT
jgi:hypothetical protein